MDKSLIKIFIIALILRLALVLIIMIFFPGNNLDMLVDSQGYQLLALNMLDGHGFSGSTHPPYAPDNKRTPGFPFYLACLYFLFGYGGVPVMIANSIVGALSCVFAYLLFRQIIAPEVAVLGSLLFAFDLESILNIPYALTETLFTLVLVIAVYFLLLSLKEKKSIYAIFSGVAFALAVYVRPSGLPLSILIFTVILIALLIRKPLNLLQLLLMISFFILTLFPWYLRNIISIGRFEFSSLPQSVAYRYFLRPYAVPEARSKNITLRQEVFTYFDDKTREWMKQNPDYYISGDGLPISDIREYQFLELIKPALQKSIRDNYPKVISKHMLSSLQLLYDSSLEMFNWDFFRNHFKLKVLTRQSIGQMLATKDFTVLREFFSNPYFPILLAAHLWTLLSSLLAVWGLIILFKNKLYLPFLLFALIFAFHIFTGGHDPVARFRLPASPYIFGLMAIAVYKFLPLKQKIFSNKRNLD